MSALTVPTTVEAAPPRPTPAVSDRRRDVDAKQAVVARLLEEADCEALLILDQANLAWLTSGAVARNILDPEQLPALMLTPTQRWLVSSNVESQRLFDEEIDELGFMLKEWPWHWGREQLLTELCGGRTVAADVAFRDSKPVTDQLRKLRREMTPYERACYAQLGALLAHALETTCRELNRSESERQIAGQLANRLMQRGAIPVAVSVAGDGRSRVYRRHGFTSAPVERYAVVTATARKFGLYATAARAVCFGGVDDALQKEHLAACKVAATCVASSWPDAVPQQIFNAVKRVYLLSGSEHEWQLAPQGHITGRLPVELTLLPEMTDLFRPGWAITWWPTAGAAAVCDTYLVTDAGPQPLTPSDDWPVVTVRVAGAEFDHPYILEREA